MRQSIVFIITVACLAGWAPAQTPAEAIEAMRSGTLEPFQLRAEDRLRELIRARGDRQEIVRLATLRSFADSFARARTLTARERQTLQWLVEHEALGPLFFTALTEQDDARRALAVLAALRESAGGRVEAWPELAVATAVVWDAPAREGQSPQECIASAGAIFDHFTAAAGAPRVDVRGLPWPILVYLVNSGVTAEERLWAVRQYRLPQAPGRAYFEVQYDHRGFASGRWPGGERHPYTLANIRRLGGVCMDQAYFASEVIRANGIPAALVTGQTSRGGGFHAWVGHLAWSGGRWEWDFQTGRYPEHGYWVGTVIDPQTGERLTDGDVSMSAQWTMVRPQDRLYSLALVQCLDLFEPAEQMEVAAEAIRVARANRRAWLAMADLCSDPSTPLETLADVAEVVNSFAVGRYDDFAFHMFTRLVQARPIPEQIDILDRARGKFPNRPDLQLELQLQKADVLQRGGREAEALRLYERLLRESLLYGPLVMEIMERLDALLRPAGRGEALLGAYRTAWRSMTAPDPSGYVSITPWYILGERYAELLEESNQRREAQQVREQLARRNTAAR